MKKKKFWQNEKGDATALVGAAIATLVIIITLMVVVFTGSEMESAAETSNLEDTFSVINETMDCDTHDVWVSLNHARVINGSDAVTNATWTATRGTDFLINDTEGKYKPLSTGEINTTDDDYNMTYNYNVRSSWGNVTDKTGSLGESSASILKVGVILMVIFAAVGFLVMPYIQDALAGRRRRD